MKKELIVILESKGNYLIDYEEKKVKIKNQKFNSQKYFYKEYQKNKYEAIYKLGIKNKKEEFSKSLKYLIKITNFYINLLSKEPTIEMLREKTKVKINEKDLEKLINSAPFMIGKQYLTKSWLRDFFENIHLCFHKDIKEFDGKVSDYFKKINPKINIVGRVFFHLVENKKSDYPFAFLATYASLVKNEVGEIKEKHLPLKNALKEYKKDSKKMLQLLSTIIKASKKSNLIKEIYSSGEIFHPIKFSSKEAYTFLCEIEMYEKMGIVCRIPKWWKKKGSNAKIVLKVGDENKSKVDYNALVSYNPEIHLDGNKLTQKEIQKLLNESEGLTLIKGKWVEVNHSKLKKALDYFEKAKKQSKELSMNIIEAFRFEQNQLLEADKDSNIDIEINNGDFLNQITSKLQSPELIDSINSDQKFKADLRKYQTKGLNWLYFMKKMGLGACLADDMGLGKTVQIIALLSYLKDNNEKSLIVLPVSLIGNWIDEIEKFAPHFSFYILHRSENKKLEKARKIFDNENIDLFITSYGMVSKIKWLKKVTWDNLIIDEAQAIKNPGTKRSKSIKELRSKFKVALTGTPIENRLGDLWSLFDFLNPGLLGNKKEFKSFVSGKIKNEGDYSQLNKIVNPFILRRLKTDEKIISDLPQKTEMKVYASLTSKQSVLYKKLVDKIIKVMNSEKEGIKRKGIILSSIMKFKQICNHPDQYLGQDLYLEKESGKFKRLKEIAKEIYENRERVLVFTQFRKLIDPLDSFLENIFNHKGHVLHGGTKVKKRKEIVESFQSEKYIPYIILSIKAGGVGLNLTKANHVIHFDRWWNPAVEDQATDRAFRIGQTKNVVVHKFITKGTIEEKIDEIIESKKELSDNIISKDESNKITEMSKEEIIDLVQLSG
ncbi:MAG: DEAD/DEAH box helicase [Bacillota bacterium]